jgi:hypothetical protein
MTSKINTQLLEQINAARDEDPRREIPIIVTLKPDTDTSILEKEGMTINRLIESISVVTGVMAASKIEALSHFEQVELIEYDGTVYALENG